MRLIRRLCLGFALSSRIPPLANALRACLSLTTATTAALAAVAPTITTQPSDKTVTLGTKATFSVVASGTATLRYQWSKRGTTISGATSASYTTPNTVAGDNGATYTVKVSNSAGNVTSAAATLTLNMPPTITTQPVSQTIDLGAAATFTVVANGTGTLSYQWSKRGVAISGAIASVYTTPPTVAGDNAATFTVKVTNAYGNVASTAANLTLMAPPPERPNITAPSIVTIGQAGYYASVPTQVGGTYAWTIMPGVITAGSTTNQITFTPNPLGPLKKARTNHKATPLLNGKVLLTGGYEYYGDNLASAELFDPTNGRCNLTGTMISSRSRHTATLLANGKVLIAGGAGGDGMNQRSAEIYDTATGIFTATGSMTVERGDHTATLLLSGMVLMTGGFSNQDILASSELYDPATGTFSLLASSLHKRSTSHTATLLSNGNVLLCGGYTEGGLTRTDAELFDPVLNTFTVTVGSMRIGRSEHTATTLLNGKILIVGGSSESVDATNISEIYDPLTGTFSSVEAHLLSPRTGHTAILLPSGHVLITGGYDQNCEWLSSAELFNGLTNSYSLIDNTMSIDRVGHASSLISNGLVLITGGMNADWEATNSVEIFDSNSSIFGNYIISSTIKNALGTASLPGTKILRTVPPPAQPVITAPQNMIAGRTYSAHVLAPPSGCTLTWTIANGSIISGNGTTDIAFTADLGTTLLSLTCSVSNAAGTNKTASVTRTIYPNIVTLRPGKTLLAPGEQIVVSADHPVTWYSPYFARISSTNTSITCKMTDNNGFILFPGTYPLYGTSNLDSSLQAVVYLTVWIEGAPLINSFNAEHSCIHSGQSTTLHWDVQNAIRLEILPAPSGDILNVIDLTNVSVSPLHTTIYRLNAYNDIGYMSAYVTVNVDLIPTVDSFMVSPQIITLGEISTITATFTNGIAHLDPDVGTIQSGIPITVEPEGATYYTMTVTNQYGGKTLGPWELVKVVDQSGTFLQTTQMAVTQAFPESVLLRDGRVFFNGTRALNSLNSNITYDAGTTVILGPIPEGGRRCQFYNPISDIFEEIPTDYRKTERARHTSTVCADGRVLLWGGNHPWGGELLFDNEIFNPSDGSFLKFPAEPRTGHTATLLDNGQILIAGGYSSTCLLVDVKESFPGHTDPTIRPTGSMGIIRSFHTAIRLMDGRVLVVGGLHVDDQGNWTNLTSAELYDPNIGIWSPVGDLHSSAAAQRPVLLPDGRVIFNGLEVFDPTTRMFTVLPMPNSQFEGFGSGGVLLGDGRILMGTDARNAGPIVYNPSNAKCLSVSAPYPASGYNPGNGIYPSMTLLQDGTVLMAAWGRRPASTWPYYQYSEDHAERFDPQTKLGILPAIAHSNVNIPITLQATGPESHNITWSASGGSVTGDGHFLAQVPGLYAITATSSNGVKATAWVDVHPAVEVKITRGALPQGAPWLRPGDTVQLTAHVFYTPNRNVNWQLAPSTTGATLTADGSFTASVAGSFTVCVTPVADPARSFDFPISVYPADLQPPALTGFEATPAILRGSDPVQVTFTWAAERADKQFLTLPDGKVEVSGLSSYTLAFTPCQMAPGLHGCNLEASNLAGLTRKTLNLQVMPLVNLGITPVSDTLYVGQQLQFGFTISAPTNRTVWNCTGGNVTQGGLYTAPTAPGTYQVTVVSVDDPGISASASLLVKDVFLQLNPSSSTLDPGQTLQFGHSYEGPAGSSLVWSCTGGTITQSGLYTAPAATGTYTVRLYSTAEPSLVRAATLTVTAPVIQVSPGFAKIAPGGTQQFQALVSSGTVIWSVVEANGGIVTEDGAYTAPLMTGTFTVKATSPVDSLQFGTATVVVSTSGGTGGSGSNTGTGATGATITLSPATLSIDAGAYYPFQAVVEGAEDTSVIWVLQDNPPDARIDPEGLFIASRQGSYTIVATSVADPTAMVTATVFVSSAIHTDDNPLTALRGYSVTALPNGKVLIAGGTPVPPVYDQNAITYSEKAYLYDPETKTYTPTGNLLTARCDHHAVLLKDGRMLLAGGYARWADPWLGGTNTSHHGQPYGHEYPFAEVYDPASGTFQALPSAIHEKPDNFYAGNVEGPGMMLDNHGFGSKALALPDGRAWIYGGVWGWWNNVAGHGSYIAMRGEGAEVFSPFTNLFAGAGTFSDGGSWVFKAHHGVALMEDGKVFVSGGLVYSQSGAGGYPARAGAAVVLWDPVSNTRQVLDSAMQVNRLGHTVTKLADGKLLIVGGGTGTGTYNNAGSMDYDFHEFEDTDTAEIFDPASNTSTLLTGKLAQPRRHHAAILLPTGQVMIVGGVHHVGTAQFVYPNDIELYDPETQTFSTMDHLDYGLSEPKLALLPDGSVFVAGQIQPPMEPPVEQTQPQGMMANRSMAADAGTSVLAGSAQFGVTKGCCVVVVAVWKCVLPYFWDWGALGVGSVGHVFVGKPDFSRLLSQFPIPHGMSGPNKYRDWAETVVAEQRGPDAVFKILLPDESAFLAAVKDHTERPTWFFAPATSDQTNCTVSANDALKKGGLPLGVLSLPESPIGFLESLNNLLATQGLSEAIGHPSYKWWIKKVQ